MADRFYIPAIGSTASVVLTDEEAHHLARVRRIRHGDRVVIFDGSGIECDAIVREVGRHEVKLNIESRRRVNRELPISITLACSPAKGDRLRWLIEKATELGVARFVPILTERSGEHARELRSERTRRWVIEACKQCGRNVFMDVTDAVAWPDFLAGCTSQSARLIAVPIGAPLEFLDHASVDGGVFIAVGPEGGFASQELEAALGRGWLPISLGPRTLRVETAALAMVSSVTACVRIKRPPWGGSVNCSAP